MRKNDLEDRLIEFASAVIDLTEQLPDTYSAVHLGKQLVRSGTSAALNYAEAQAAESRADFIHKIKVALKELKESFVCLKILKKKQYLDVSNSGFALKEANELISILVTSVKTARKNIS